MDFDAPGDWPELLGERVTAICSETTGNDGFTYLVVLDAEVME